MDQWFLQESGKKGKPYHSGVVYHVRVDDCIRHASFPSNSASYMPHFTMKYLMKFARPSNPFFPHQIIFSMFSSFPHPSANFKALFRTSSHRSSTLRSGISKSSGWHAKIASLTYLVASGTVSSMCLIRSNNFSKKLVMGGVGLMITDGTTTTGLLGTGGAAILVRDNAWPCTDVNEAIDKGTRAGHCQLKNDNKVGLFASFSWVGHFSFAFRQIFMPQWFFLRLASPAVPQCIWVLQSGHMAYPLVSRTGLQLTYLPNPQSDFHILRPPCLHLCVRWFSNYWKFNCWEFWVF